MDDTTPKYYEVAVTFHAIKDIEYFYKVEAIDKKSAVKNAINVACKDLKITRVESIGNGIWDVVVNFHGIDNSDKYIAVSSSTEASAIQMAINEAKHSFSGKALFYY